MSHLLGSHPHLSTRGKAYCAVLVEKDAGVAEVAHSSVSKVRLFSSTVLIVSGPLRGGVCAGLAKKGQK